MSFNDTYMLTVNAHSPEELFPDVRTAAELKKAVRKLSAVLHPDANPQNPVDSDAAFKRLTTWAARAALKIRDGTWRDGKPSAEFAFRTNGGLYEVFGLSRREALFDSIDVAKDGEPALLHIARAEKHEALVANALRALRASNLTGVPVYVDSVKLRGRVAYITTPIPRGFVTLDSLMAAAPAGLQPAAILPSVYSLLTTLTQLSALALLHGAINPSTWWICPETSESYLTDWHYSVRRGEIIAHQNDTYMGLSPWEVREKRITDRGTDLAAVMLVLREAMGASPVPLKLNQLILAHLRENRTRPSDPAACRRQIREFI